MNTAQTISMKVTYMRIIFRLPVQTEIAKYKLQDFFAYLYRDRPTKKVEHQVIVTIAYLPYLP